MLAILFFLVIHENQLQSLNECGKGDIHNESLMSHKNLINVSLIILHFQLMSTLSCGLHDDDTLERCTFCSSASFVRHPIVPNVRSYAKVEMGLSKPAKLNIADEE